jgi:hypothetical protein
MGKSSVEGVGGKLTALQVADDKCTGKGDLLAECTIFSPSPTPPPPSQTLDAGACQRE